jgi:hypothetical protein
MRLIAIIIFLFGLSADLPDLKSQISSTDSSKLLSESLRFFNFDFLESRYNRITDIYKNPSANGNILISTPSPFIQQNMLISKPDSTIEYYILIPQHHQKK